MKRIACLLFTALLPFAHAEDGGQILSATGITGGVIVHIGCGDGTLTMALRPNDRYVVHGLATDPADVARARTAIHETGLTGKVSVDLLVGGQLPYVDNLVNLVVAEALGEVTQVEILRVLCPNGVAYVKQAGAWTLTRKPRPTNIDDWTHYLHGADNNAVANDTVVGPPRRTQWQGSPKWTRHHDKMSSISALVSSGGRLFYIIDEGSHASIMLPSRWALVSRDAFNGKVLWKRRIPKWYTRFIGLKSGPADAPRRLIAVDGRVYATLSLGGPLSCLDADTGATVRRYEQTQGAEEVVLSGGVLFVLIGPGSIGDGRRSARPAEKRIVMALDAKSGKKLWQTSDVVAALTLAVDGARAYYFNFVQRNLVALDRKTGKKLWTSDGLPTPQKQTSFFAQKLVVSDGVVLFASGEVSGMIKSTGGATKDDTLTAVDAATGKTLWKAEHPPSGYSSPENVFVIDGLVWCDASSNGSLAGSVVAFDLKTGAVKQKFPADETSYWFHHRCHPGRATSKYVLTSRTGIEFVDIKTKHWDLNHWVRGACLYGIMPANGLVYTPPNPCACYMETLLHGFNALAPARPLPKSTTPQLQKGPAFGGIPDAKSQMPDPQDWPTYRHDAARTGTTKTVVPGKLSTAWKTKLAGKLTAVTVAGGKVFVAEVDRHTVHALDAETGKALWRVTVGGRVDSPPTYYQGAIL
ncbi:PQQ-binding-like beta-propeller repeat protein, partial [bacterium]|nr:PQQ-binding-like beta-propeller repeat protein [bacterium]